MNEFFNASKPTRQDAFKFRNQDPAALAAVVAGDQSAMVHPFPASLAPGQKVGPPAGEPAPQSAELFGMDREGNNTAGTTPETF